MKATDDFLDQAAIDGAIDAACGSIAPTWPLDRFIAVNPYWHWTDRPFDAAARELARLTGTSLYRRREDYFAAWARGEFTREDLEHAIADSGAVTTVDRVIADLRKARRHPAGLPMPSDAAGPSGAHGVPPSLGDAITLQVSQFCAAWFDGDQADWHPVRERALFPAWRDAVTHDLALDLVPSKSQAREWLASLPAAGRAAIPPMVRRLGVAREDVPCLLTAVLMRIGGWASWCAFLRWDARLAGRDDDAIMDLLAIRLAWEALADDGRRDDASAWHRWQNAWRKAAPLPGADTFLPDRLAQRALERAYQRSLLAKLAAAGQATVDHGTPAVQAAFCIDVRSEVFRRSLEAVAPAVHTLGFAGFFGLPVAYGALGATTVRPQLPGLLGAAWVAQETTGDTAADTALAARRRARHADRAVNETFGRLPGSAFTLVESRGLGYVPRLLGRTLRSTGHRRAWDQEGLRGDEAAGLHVRLGHAAALPVTERAGLAGRILRAMHLTRDFARLVMLAGHGSQTANNAHEAGLDCGACGGQTGEVNARALATLLNDAAVRAALKADGIDIPDTTRFVGALHNTTTDDVELFETQSVPASHASDLLQLQSWLAQAGDRARAERAPALGLAAIADQPAALKKAVLARANDWSQTRPEWGLANNAALVVGPRALTRGANLGGRVFLHEYAWTDDPEGAALAGILTAPMVVTHWINMQYHASTVDNARYGSGNKILHNVVGGRIGVFEGNQGDLRIGLPMQSLHDGEQWRHTPLRLTAVVAAPTDTIDKVIDGHEVVRRLVEHEWVWLVARDPATGVTRMRSRAGWMPFP